MPKLLVAEERSSLGYLRCFREVIEEVEAGKGLLG